jgi:hypothetical protein
MREGPVRANVALRASDADRERMIEMLRAHHLEGRLDAQEFEQRLQRCLQARTVGELNDLSSDLPDGRALGRTRTRNARWLLVAAPTAIVVAAAVLVTGAHALVPIPLLFFALARRCGWRWTGPAARSWRGDRAARA